MSNEQVGNTPMEDGAPQKDEAVPQVYVTHDLPEQQNGEDVVYTLEEEKQPEEVEMKIQGQPKSDGNDGVEDDEAKVSSNTTAGIPEDSTPPAAGLQDDVPPTNGVPIVYDPAKDPMMVSESTPNDNQNEAAKKSEAAGHVPPLAAPPPAKKRRTGTKRSSARPWNDYLFELLKYRLMHGNVMVPFKSGGDLGKWVANQRAQYMGLQKSMMRDDNVAKTKWLNSEGTERLTEDRMQVLTSIGFVWDVVQADNDARWKKRFEELVHYKAVNGHCNVPQSTDLGKWVKMQRENKHESDLKKAGTTPHRKKPKPCLSEDRIDKLESIGFQWRVAKPAVGWDKRFQQLVDYKREHGDCNVPQSYPPDKPFGRWVMKQRCQHSLKLRGEKSQLTDEREQKLNDIEFAWVAPGFSKKTVSMPDDEEEAQLLHNMQNVVVHTEGGDMGIPTHHHHHHHHPDEFSTWNV